VGQMYCLVLGGSERLTRTPLRKEVWYLVFQRSFMFTVLMVVAKRLKSQSPMEVQRGRTWRNFRLYGTGWSFSLCCFCLCKHHTFGLHILFRGQLALFYKGILPISRDLETLHHIEAKISD
jgi:hypothetical protein